MAIVARREKRPSDVIGAAVMVARIATGEIAEEFRKAAGKVRIGHAGDMARAESISEGYRSAVGRKAAAAQWG